MSTEYKIVSSGMRRRARDRRRLLSDLDRAPRALLVQACSVDVLTGADLRDHGLLRVRPGSHLSYIDLDGFKPINDHFGHGAGDEVLATVVGRLSLHGRVVRMGGDEFVLISDAPIAGLSAVIEEPILTACGVVRVGASVGTVWVGRDVNAALGLAEARMRAAKRVVSARDDRCR